MTIGTGTLLTMAGIGAAGSLGGAYLQSRAAGQASSQQQAAAQQAMAAQGPLYQQALSIAQQQAQQGQARLDPWAQQGGAGLTALSSLLGVSPAGAPARTAVLSPLGGAAALSGLPTPGAGPAGATVLLRAPTGQTQAVPAAQAAFFLARGATQV